MAQGDQGRPCWSGSLWSHCWSPADPREAGGDLAESGAGVWVQCLLPIGEQKAAQEPVGQGTGSSSTTSAVISCHFIIHAVVLTPQFLEWCDYMKLAAFVCFI